MKKILYAIVFLAAGFSAAAQEFNKNLATARSSYSAGKLEDARFAMQAMLNDIDLIIGRELLKKLPQQMETMPANVKSDNVTTNTGIAGVLVHRDYGTGEKTSSIEIMSHSPLVGSINAILSLPFVGNSGDGTQKVIKVQGYKAMLQKNVDTETNKTNFVLQIPLNTTLLTLNVNDSNEQAVIKMANSIPVADIAKMVQ